MDPFFVNIHLHVLVESYRTRINTDLYGFTQIKSAKIHLICADLCAIFLSKFKNDTKLFVKP